MGMMHVYLVWGFGVILLLILLLNTGLTLPQFQNLKQSEIYIQLLKISETEQISTCGVHLNHITTNRHDFEINLHSSITYGLIKVEKAKIFFILSIHEVLDAREYICHRRSNQSNAWCISTQHARASKRQGFMTRFDLSSKIQYI